MAYCTQPQPVIPQDRELVIVPVERPATPRPAPWSPDVDDRHGGADRRPPCDRHNRRRCPRCRHA